MCECEYTHMWMTWSYKCSSTLMVLLCFAPCLARNMKRDPTCDNYKTIIIVNIERGRERGWSEGVEREGRQYTVWLTEKGCCWCLPNITSKRMSTTLCLVGIPGNSTLHRKEETERDRERCTAASIHTASRDIHTHKCTKMHFKCRHTLSECHQTSTLQIPNNGNTSMY